MAQYIIEPNLLGVKINNPSPNYSLEIEFERRGGRPTFLDIRFFYDMGGPTRMLVYERDAQDYFNNFDKLKLNPKLQYVDAGAGLAGLVPFLVAKFGQKLVSRPIIIDPVDYNLMSSMLRSAQELNLGTDIDKRLKELTQRTEIILDSEKVYLVNMTLGNAIREIPELKGTADVVIDFLGPSNYPSTEISGSEPSADIEGIVLEMERMLLKPDGLHLFKSATR